MQKVQKKQKMQKIKIITDTASDLDIKLAEEQDILVLPFKVIFNDKEYKESYDFSKKEFYGMLGEYDGIPSHSQITPFEWLESIEKCVSEGYKEIIIVPINQNGSATFKSALTARMQFYNEHYSQDEEKDVKIYIVNTLSYSLSYGYPVLEASKMIKAGKTVGEILEFFDDWFNSYELYFVAFDLKYAKQSGRIGTASAIAGELLGIKPVIDLTAGKSTTFSKVRSIPKAYEVMLDTAKSKMRSDKKYLVIYGDNEEDYAEFKKIAKKELGEEALMSAQIGACITCNAGPKVIGLGFLSEKRNEQIIF